MKFYSEVTKKLYENVEELRSAEKAYSTFQETKAREEQEIEKLKAELLVAQNKLKDATNKYNLRYNEVEKKDKKVSVQSDLDDLLSIFDSVWN